MQGKVILQSRTLEEVAEDFNRYSERRLVTEDQLIIRLHLVNGLRLAVAAHPIVRLVSEDGHVHYCRTFDHSTMAVATGHRRVHTRFTVPAGLAHGRYDLRVVANGIASREVEVRVS